MATVTLAVTPVASTTNATSYVSPSFTPAAGDLLVVFVRAGATADVGAMTSSTGLGFTKVNHATFAASAHRVYCFVANAAATATAMTVTFSCASDAADGAVIVPYRVANMPVFGLSAIRQNAVTNNGAAAGTPAVTFGTAALSGDCTLGMVGNGASPATLTPPVGWTEDSDTGYSTPTSGAEAVHRDTGFLASTITWGGTSATTYGVLAVELAALAVANVNLLTTPKYITKRVLRPPAWRLLRVGFSSAADATVSPGVAATVSALPAPTVSTGSTPTPATVVTVSTLPSPAAGVGVASSPPAVVTASTLPAPAVSTGTSSTPATVVTVTALPAATPTAASIISPAAIVTAVTVPTPSISAGANTTVTITTVATVSAVPSVSLSTGERAAVASVVTATALPAPTVQTGTKTTPAAIVTTTAVGAAATSAGIRVTPAPVATVSTVPAPAVGAQAQVLAAVIVTVSTLPGPTLKTGSRITPARVATVATLPAPTLPVLGWYFTFRPSGDTPRVLAGFTARP